MTTPDDHPRLVYDDRCGFCTWAATFALRRGDFEPVGFSELTPDQLSRLPDDYRDAVHLLTDDAVYSAGEATEQVLARCYPRLRPMFDALHTIPGYPWLRDRCYRVLADNRGRLGRVWQHQPPAGP